NPVYTDFEDVLGELAEVDLPGITPGTDFARFQAKAEAYLRQHLDNLTLQRLRRGRQLTESDLVELERLLVAAGGQRGDIAWAREQADGLGLFVRTLVGLDRQSVAEEFAGYLDGSRFTVEQLRFVELIVEELTRNGVMEPARLYESPYTDHAPTGPDLFFGEADVDAIIETL